MQIQLNNLTIEKDIPSPKWHKEELLAREKNLKENKEKITDWKKARKDILEIINENKNS